MATYVLSQRMPAMTGYVDSPVALFMAVATRMPGARNVA